MKRFSKLIYLVLVFTGCAGGPEQRLYVRQSVGRPMYETGAKIGKVGTTIIATSGVTFILIPVGVALGAPLLLIALPLYYGGCAIAGDDTDSGPFDL